MTSAASEYRGLTQLEDKTTERFSPLVAWSIVLLASVALWGVLGLAISSVVMALL